MFLINKYYKWYCSIISNSIYRVLISPEKTEKHHIIPKSLGGSDKKYNIAILSLREHFICHLLLTKFTKGNDKVKMDKAAWILCHKNDRKINSRTFTKLRKNYLHSSHGENNSMYGTYWINNLTEEKRISIYEELPSGWSIGRVDFKLTTIEKMKSHALVRFSNPENNPFHGKKHTTDTINKIKNNLPDCAGSKNANYKGLTVATNIHTGEKLYFKGKQEIKDAGFHPGAVSQCILGKNKSHKQYYWTRMCKD